MAANKRVARVIAQVGGIPAETAGKVAEALMEQGLLAAAPARSSLAASRVGRRLLERSAAELASPAAPEVPPVRISLRLELGVAGYHAGNSEMEGTIDGVALALDGVARKHYQAVQSAWERNGDHRAYCPSYSNGYPSADPSDGDVATFTVLSVNLLSDRAKPQAVPYQSRLHRFLQQVANGDHRDVAAATADFLGRSRGRSADAETAGPAPR